MTSSLFRTLAVIVLTAFGGTALADDIRIQGGGASFPEPIYQRWVTEYQKANPSVKIDYQSIGSGGGIKGITDQTFHFAGSDAPLNKKQIEGLGGEDKIVEIPTVAGAVVLACNIPDFKGELKLDGETVADIFLGKIRNWNDAKIAALNGDAKLPDLAITPVHRTDGSGTSFIFTNYLATQSQEFKEKVGSGTQVEWPGGMGGPQNAGVAQIVQTTKGAVGYVELIYALKNNIAFATMKNKDGEFVKASEASAALAGKAAAEHMKGTILATPLWNQPGKEVYPIAAFTYIIVYKDLKNLKSKEQAEALVGFLAWANGDGQKLAGDLHYAPLDPAVQAKVAEAIKTLTFNGAALATK